MSRIYYDGGIAYAYGTRGRVADDVCALIDGRAVALRGRRPKLDERYNYLTQADAPAQVVAFFKGDDDGV